MLLIKIEILRLKVLEDKIKRIIKFKDDEK